MNDRLKGKHIEWTQITLGVISLAIGFYFFLSPEALVTGGVSGISILVRPLKLMSDALFLLIMNVIALLIGWAFLGKQFFIRTAYSTLLYPVIIFIFEKTNISPNLIINQISENNRLLIAALFGGFFVGSGIGLVIRHNATTGGMDVYQKIISQKFHIPFSFVLYFTDGIVILLAMTTISFEVGLYGLISMIIAGIVIDKVAVIGKNSYTVFIVTNDPEGLKKVIFSNLKRGLTKVSVRGGFTDEEKSMVICTLYRQQLYILKKIISENDQNAFTFIVKTNEVIGEGFWKGN
ncbi:conserved hypothetical protein [Alteracholeplasma palmae J233]|uniref:DUF2179 domain-containing protein n=1 Tax=Alteracholeplasma palmae (strain ATCC 49389 / J233) TaxID=1318466 RepID=U4KKD2_ALTPJ|nr:conserved hypothetical protein [Alteracholeplasma palmae J233]